MPITLTLWNTLSGKKERLALTTRKPIKLFVCGPTVYDAAHIGNARVYLFFDSFVKYLRSLGIKITYLQNITDIDDKIIIRAGEEHLPARAIAARYKRFYLKNMAQLKVSAVDHYAPATAHIPHIIKQIQTLIKKKHVYKIEGDGYYFDTATFPRYGKLSRRTAAQAEDGVSRIDESVHKRNKADFCVWKLYHPAPKKHGTSEPHWKTSLGNGRPGWHIEDTAITEKYFGPQYDIHGGGIDLKFPHHEAEIAQQESASGKTPFVKFWMHVGPVMMESKKMSKSVGNVLTIDDLLKTFDPEVLRLIMLTHHYRTPIDFSDTLARSAARTWHSILIFIARLRRVAALGNKNAYSISLHPLHATLDKFHGAMRDDVSTPRALSALFTYMNAIHPHLWRLSQSDAKTYVTFFTDALTSLGLVPRLPVIPKDITHLAQEREAYRGNKQFTQADRLRKRIAALGYLLEDSPLGPFLFPTQNSGGPR